MATVSFTTCALTQKYYAAAMKTTTAFMYRNKSFVTWHVPVTTSFQTRIIDCIGTGKSFGVRQVLARISPNLPEIFWVNFLCEYFLPTKIQDHELLF